MCLFKDDSSGFRVIECLKTKPETLQAFKRFVAQLKRETCQTAKVLRSDCGTEYTNGAFTRFLDEHEIHQELTVTYSPQQNRAAERENRTIIEAVRTMLYAANVHVKFWADAAYTAVYTLNCSTTRTIIRSTPYKKWHKTKPSVAHLRAFGANAYVHIPKNLRKKLSAKSRKGVFMGYSKTSKGYRVWVNELRRIEESRDVLFNEDFSDTNISGKHPDPTQWLQLTG